jgi:diguanylate cyclase (GGDEF)-like protein/PAS domain S-box-containing protein
MLDTVKVPKQFEQIFQKAEEYVSKYFKERKDTPSKGTIEIFGERYILVRAASMSIDFFETVKSLYKDQGEESALNVARQLLFDIAHAIGKQDAKNFHNKMKLKNPVEKLSAGPIHFSHSGWAFVDIFPESRPTADENYYLIYDHPFSFESDAWEKAGKKSDSPVCVMNAGYSSGWCEESFGVSLVASEIMCRAKGDDTCRFIMAHPSKIEAYIRDYLKKEPELAKKIINYEIPGFFKRKEMEEELRRAHNELEIRVKERTAELTAANAQQKKSKARLIEAQRIAHLGNWDWDIEKNELSWSDEIYRIFGLSPQEFGASYEAFLNVIHPGDREFVKQSLNEALSGKRPYSIDHRIVLPDGTIRIVHEQGEVTHDKPGKPIHMAGTVQVITARKEMEEKLQYFAYYDALTGLPNRSLYVDRLNQVLARAAYHKKAFAVLAIDIDGFKFINDTFGLAAGDNVLKEVGGILSASIRKGDTAARLGSDDFGILLTDIAHSKDVILVVEKIMKNVSQPITVDGKEIVLTFSMGVSVYPDDGKDVHELMRNADLALSKAKQQGRKTFQFYTADMNEEASEFVLLEKHLRNALKNEEFILYYQPYWEINTKKIAGMEALLRWQSKDLGLDFQNSLQAG